MISSFFCFVLDEVSQWLLRWKFQTLPWFLIGINCKITQVLICFTVYMLKIISATILNVHFMFSEVIVLSACSNAPLWLPWCTVRKPWSVCASSMPGGNLRWVPTRLYCGNEFILWIYGAFVLIRELFSQRCWCPETSQVSFDCFKIFYG